MSSPSHVFVCFFVLLYTSTKCHRLLPPGIPVLTGFDRPVEVGTRHTATCSAYRYGAGTITYRWYRDRRNIVIRHGPTLTWYYIRAPYMPFSNGSLGSYRCTASNAAGTRYSEWADLIVYVNSPPKKPLTSGFTDPVVVNTNHQLSCQAWQEWAMNIQYSWYRGSHQVSSWNASSLYLAPVKKEDGGDYRCRASNAAGTTESDAKTLKVYFPNAKVVMSESPVGPIVEGGEKTLHCETDESNPGSSLRWYQLLNDSYHEITRDINLWQENGLFGGKISNSSLNITADRTFNGRRYKCVSIYIETNGRRVEHQAVRKLYVIFPNAKVVMSESPVDPISEGGEKTLHCETDESNPGSSLRWYQLLNDSYQEIARDITLWQENGLFAGKVSNSSLNITVDRTLNGRRYRCLSVYLTANGSTVEKQADWKLTVYFPTTEVVVNENPDGPIVEGGEKVLHCETDESNPGSSLRWYQLMDNGYQEIMGGITLSQKIGHFGGKISKSSLKFTVDRTLNGRQYRCVSIYLKTDGSTVENQAGGNLTVYFANGEVHLSEDPMGPILEGGEKTLHCTTDESNPGSSIRWYQLMDKSYQEIMRGINSSRKNGQFEGKISQSSLKIIADRTLNKRRYRCVSIYLKRDGSRTEYQTFWKLDVVWPSTTLEMVTKPESHVSIGAEVILKCETDNSNSGFQETILWNRLRPPENKTEAITAGIGTSQRSGDYGGTVYGSELNFTAQKEDDQAIYECKTKGRVPLKNQTTITVYYAPKWNHRFIKSFEVAAKVRHPALFSLQVILNPGPPKVSLYKENASTTVLYRTHTTAIVDMGEQAFSILLQIPEVKVDDYGTFVITVGNKMGETNFTLILLSTDTAPPSGHTGQIVGLSVSTTIAILLSITFVVLIVLLRRYIRKGEENRMTPGGKNTSVVYDKELALYDNLAMVDDNQQTQKQQESRLDDTNQNTYEFLSDDLKESPNVYDVLQSTNNGLS